MYDGVAAKRSLPARLLDVAVLGGSRCFGRAVGVRILVGEGTLTSWVIFSPHSSLVPWLYGLGKENRTLSPG